MSHLAVGEQLSPAVRPEVQERAEEIEHRSDRRSPRVGRAHLVHVRAWAWACMCMCTGMGRAWACACMFAYAAQLKRACMCMCMFTCTPLHGAREQSNVRDMHGAWRVHACVHVRAFLRSGRPCPLEQVATTAPPTGTRKFLSVDWWAGGEAG